MLRLVGPPSSVTSRSDQRPAAGRIGVGHPSITILRCEDITLDGCLLVSDVPVQPGDRQPLEFCNDDGLRIVLDAVPVHCHALQGGARFRSGWEFVSDDRSGAAIEALLDC